MRGQKHGPDWTCIWGNPVQDEAVSSPNIMALSADRRPFAELFPGSGAAGMVDRVAVARNGVHTAHL